jgi:hypothetical protein
MDYALLTSGTPNNKPQAQWVCNTLLANTLSALNLFITGISATSATIGNLLVTDTLTTPGVTLVDESKTPPNPPSGNITLYADSVGRLSSVNPLGVVTIYPTPSQQITQTSIQWSQVTVFNDATEQSLATLDGVSPMNIPSLPIMGSNPNTPGQTIKLKMQYQEKGVAAATYALKFKINGVTVLTSPDIVSSAGYLDGFVDVLCSVGEDFINLGWQINRDGTLPIIPPLARVGYNATIVNVIDVTVQWSAADGNNVFICYQLGVNVANP